MPATEHALRLTDAHQARTLALRDRTVAAIASAWAMIDWQDLDGSFRRWLPAASHAVTVAQAEAVRMSSAYLSLFVEAETAAPGEAPPADPDSYAGLTRDGRRVAANLAAALVATKLAVAHRRPQRDALNAGLAHAVRVARLEVVDAGRRALTDSMEAEPRVVGWRRVARLRACGACLADADGRTHRPSAMLRIHSSCGCAQEPVVRDAPERKRRPTGEETFRRMPPEEQDRLFAGRGGAAKADLIRSGRASFPDLITTERSHATGVWITETPLETLARSAS